MQNDFFIALEQAPDQHSLALTEVLSQLAYNEQGLLPVIAQDADSGEVLMHAWMNAQALDVTLSSGKMTYWSRSRQALWEKGATSGHRQALVAMRIDCDGDTLLCQVRQSGPACHTGRANCFYLQVDQDRGAVVVQGEAN